MQARRLVDAAEAAVAAGDLRRAAAITRRAAATLTGTALRLRVGRLRAAAEFELGSPRTAARILLDAAAGMSGPIVAEMLVDAAQDGYIGGAADLTLQAAVMLQEAAPESPFAAGMLGLARVMTEDAAAAIPSMRALTAYALSDPDPALSRGQRLVAGAMGLITGDHDSAMEVFQVLVAEARDQTALGCLPIALEHLAIAEFFAGQVHEAKTHAQEGLVLADSTGQTHRLDHLRCVLAWIAALSGDESRCRDLTEAAVGPALDRRNIRSAAWGTMALSLLDMGLARYERALDRLEAAAQGPLITHHATVSFAPDQVEAAVHLGCPERAAAPLHRFRNWAAASGRPWALAVTERCTALVTAGDAAGEHFAEAVRLHAKDSRPFECARTDLLFGEWLRRAKRKADARTRLRAALRTFEQLGAVPWAERARAELRATGDTTLTTPSESRLDQLTPQELQVVRLAAQGKSNREIAAQLFLSARTVGYHLYNAYPKLGVAGRGELAGLLRP